MTVPANCTTIHVSNVSGNAICNTDADYVLDTAMGHWVNENNPSCRIAKFVDGDGSTTGTAGAQYWGWLVLTPPGSTAPPGSTSIFMGNFPCSCFKATFSEATNDYVTSEIGTIEVIEAGVHQFFQNETWYNSTCGNTSGVISLSNAMLTDSSGVQTVVSVVANYNAGTSSFEWTYAWSNSDGVNSSNNSFNGGTGNVTLTFYSSGTEISIDLPLIEWKDVNDFGWSASPQTTIIVNSITAPDLDFTSDGWIDLTGSESCFSPGWQFISGSNQWANASTDCPADADWTRGGAVTAPLSISLGSGTDTDGDGVPDSTDAFPNDPFESVDSDGDGVGDNADEFPNDATETTDTDGDGVGDNADIDDDDDGILDGVDPTPLGEPPTAEQAPSSPVAYSLDAPTVPIFRGWTKPTKFKGYVLDDLSSSLSGPFVSESITAITSIQNRPQLLCVNEQKDIKKVDLRGIRESDFDVVISPWTNTLQIPSHDNFIVGNKDGAFSYRGRYLSDPFSVSQIGHSEITNPLFFEYGNLSIAETAWIHLGDEHSAKQVHRVDLSFRTNSFGHLWLFVQNDEGKVKGQYKGQIKEHVKVFTSLRGRRVRLRMFVATHKDYPWNLREMSIGHLKGGSF